MCIYMWYISIYIHTRVYIYVYICTYMIYMESSLLAVTVSTRQSTKMSTRETAKFKHNLPCKAPFFAACAIALPSCKHELEQPKWHEATHQKARTGARKMARGNPPKARGTAAERARRSGRWKIDTHRSYHSSPRLPVPKKNNLLCAPFGGVPIWKSLFLTVTGIRQDSRYTWMTILLLPRNAAS